jgi:hypothetical protein
MSFTGRFENMLLIDEGVGYVILLLLLAEMMNRKGIPGHWAMMALFAACTYPAPLSNHYCHLPRRGYSGHVA